jgi:HSF-type DNA-binding
MLMLMHIERYFTKQGWGLEKAPIAWTSNGRAFIIRDNDKLVSDWLPIFFQKGKFSSFKRKLYRWGFRQVQLLNHDLSTIGNRELVFGNENFQRDQKVLLPRMKSITAESLRRQQAAAQKQQRKEAVAMDGENPQAVLKQEHQPLNGLAVQNQQNEVLHTLTALLSPIGLPPQAPPRPLQQQQEGGPTPSELAAVLSTMNPSVAPNSQKALDLATAALMLQQHAANTMQEQHHQQPTRASQHTLGAVSSLLQGTNNAATLQQILHNLQEQQRRQQQEEMIKNIHRMMFPSQQHTAAPASLDSSTSSQQSMMARLILQQLGSLGANGH